MARERITWKWLLTSCKLLRVLGFPGLPRLEFYRPHLKLRPGSPILSPKSRSPSKIRYSRDCQTAAEGASVFTAGLDCRLACRGACAHTCTCTLMCVGVCVYTYTDICIIYAYVCTHACIYALVFVCVCVCVFLLAFCAHTGRHLVVYFLLIRSAVNHSALY